MLRSLILLRSLRAGNPGEGRLAWAPGDQPPAGVGDERLSAPPHLSPSPFRVSLSLSHLGLLGDSYCNLAFTPSWQNRADGTQKCTLTPVAFHLKSVFCRLPTFLLLFAIPLSLKGASQTGETGFGGAWQGAPAGTGGVCAGTASSSRQPDTQGGAATDHE